MTPPTAIPNRGRRFPTLPLILVGALLVVSGPVAFPIVERFFIEQAADRSETTLVLAVEGLNGALQRYEALPGLIAERPELALLLDDPADGALADAISEEFRLTADDVEASDIYLMDFDGLTLAASSYLKELSFVGRSFGYRPYFTEAIAGGLGRFFALGTTSGERGYFFAAPVLGETGPIGVVAVKFTVDTFETAWAQGESDIIVQDLAGVVFMSSRTDWHFRSLGPLDDAARNRIEETRQYPLESVRPLAVERESFGGGRDLLTIGEGAEGSTEFLLSRRDIPAAGWVVSILTPTEPARGQALAAIALMGLAVLVVGLATAVVLQRRARLNERIEAARTLQEELERRVKLRTAELDTANTQLLQEVEDRTATEHKLRRTQTELVQAGKLAALGQMSAALSHEFNQPLAAVKAFAGNAETLLARGRVDAARENVKDINEMADRMAAISGHLRNFARRPSDTTTDVSLTKALADATAILEPRLHAAGASISTSGAAPDIWVRGGQIRLQQVIVNLLSNALDAMEGQSAPVIEVETALQDGRALLSVRDRGAGLSDDAIDLLFDPFFTTKEPGKGMGLGLSISYNIVRDFGGTLRAANHPEGGAVFTVDLEEVAGPLPEAAE